MRKKLVASEKMPASEKQQEKKFLRVNKLL